MTIRELLNECLKALEHGAELNTPVMMALHDLEDVNEIVEIIAAESCPPDTDGTIPYLELFHAYSLPASPSGLNN